MSHEVSDGRHGPPPRPLPHLHRRLAPWSQAFINQQFFCVQMVSTLVYHDIRIGKDPKGGAKNIFLFLQKACLRLWHVQVIK